MEAIAGEYEDKKQAYAICMDTYRESKKTLGTPKTDDERCKDHFGLSDEAWGALSDEEKQEYRDKLPKRGEGLDKGESFKCYTKLISKSAESFIIGGYANVYMLDKAGGVVPDYEGETVTLDALDEALNLMMAEQSRRNHAVYHTNIQIGEIIWETTDGDGVTWKTHVVREPSSQYPKQGLFILSKVFSDTPPALEARRLMEQEGKLLSFSIGGLPLAEERRCDTDKCWTEITKLYLAEVSSCDKGINAESKAFILKELSKQREETQSLLPSGSNKQNNYIGENTVNQLDDTEGVNVSSDEEPKETVKQSTLAEEHRDTESDAKPIEEKKLDNEPLEPEEPIVEPVVEDEEPVEKAPEPVKEPISEEPAAEEPEPVEKTGEPLREDFDSPDAFMKAYKAWYDSEKEKEPITMKTLDEKLTSFKKDLLESLSDVEIDGAKLGEVVKKSVKVIQKTSPVVIDLASREKFLYKGNAPRVEQ